VIHLASRDLALPEGVTVAEWALERLRDQNPRIRAFLGCIRLLGEVLESNYAILHCSPDRLREIWRRVRRVAHLMRTELEPLLARRSLIPRLDEAVKSAHDALLMLDRAVLADLDRFPETVTYDQLVPVRKLLCVSIGQLHAFLQDAFGEIMASDPRSVHDADYYLSRRFPQDIDEAEWLYATVDKLAAYLVTLEAQRLALLVPLVEHLVDRRWIPEGEPWESAKTFLDELIGGLTPRLKEVLALRGIRFNEMEILDRYAVEIPTLCRLIVEVHEQARALELSGADAEPQRARALAGRLSALIGEVDTHLRDLIAFVPLWIDSITKRRALLLRRSRDDDEAPPAVASA